MHEQASKNSRARFRRIESIKAVEHALENSSENLQWGSGNGHPAAKGVRLKEFGKNLTRTSTSDKYQTPHDIKKIVTNMKK